MNGLYFSESKSDAFAQLQRWIRQLNLLILTTERFVMKRSEAADHFALVNLKTYQQISREMKL